MDDQIELDKITQQSQLPEVVPSTSSRSSKTWPKDSTFMFAVISSILCFPPFGVLTFIKSRQYRRAKLADDVEAAQRLSRDGRHLALISCLMGLTFVAMVTTVLLLQLLYFQEMAADMKASWNRKYFVKTFNLSTNNHGT